MKMNGAIAVDSETGQKKFTARQCVELIVFLLLKPEWICVKGRNRHTSAAETDMSVVTLPSQKFKAWQKMRLEVTIGKWTEEQRVASPQINSGSAVEAEASFSVP